MELISAGACLVVFLALYAVLRGRDRHRPIQWGWLAAIVGFAALAFVIGVLTR
jgi:drug/metabolite transporter (DMT)-like permease